MNHKSTHNPMEAKMKLGTHHTSDLMFATQHIRESCTESACTTASDYKDFFESLKNVSEPTQVMSIFYNHLQKRFLHNVQTWNDLRIAVAQNQMVMVPWFRYEVPTPATQYQNDAVKEGFSLMDPFSSAFNYMAEAVQNTRVSDEETDEADASLKKSVPVKNGKLHANHSKRMDGRA